MAPTRRLLRAALAVAAPILVVALAWPRAQLWLYRALIAISVVALWPCIFFVVAIAVGLTFGLVGLHYAGEVPLRAVGAVGVEASRWWIGFLRRVRYPIFWGVAIGLVVGTLVSIGAIAAIRAPRDARTLRVLDETAALGHDAIARAAQGVSPVLDGYGRPLRFVRDGHSFTATYRLRSAGYDGIFDTDDDLCGERESRLVQVGKSFVARHLRAHGGSPAEWAVLFDGLKASECPSP